MSDFRSAALDDEFINTQGPSIAMCPQVEAIRNQTDEHLPDLIECEALQSCFTWMSHRSESIHEGPPTTRKPWTLYAVIRRHFSVMPDAAVVPPADAERECAVVQVGGFDGCDFERGEVLIDCV